MISFFKQAAARWGRTLAALVVLLLLAGIIAPFVNAAPFSGRIQLALESLLGRSVSFRAAHFTLLNGPGFSLSDVTIGEDPRFGAEPFAFVPTLNARIRLDRFMLGQIAVSSIRLIDPSVNLVRGSDGSWNMVELVSRLTGSSGISLHLFPTVQISNGRVDFKMGVRKTNIYLTDTDLGIYGEGSDKLYVQFSGSPARTDRAGNGFGHMSGEVNWYLHPTGDANQLEGDLKLDRSNLSELSTLFQGEDSGVHGTISGRARIAGPAAALHVAGDVHLEDIHRWDLLPSTGEDWRVAYDGLINLPARSIDLKTIPSDSHSPEVQLAVKGTNVLARPVWSLLANLNNAPVAGLLPLARRMGLGLPAALTLDGKISGAVSYSSTAGWTGGVAVNQFEASVPNVPAFHADTVSARMETDRIHLESARIPSGDDGWLDVSGNYDRKAEGMQVTLSMNQYPAENLRNVFGEWLHAPNALSAFQAGTLTGNLDYTQVGSAEPAWSGKFGFVAGEVAVEGLPDRITEARGQVSFDNTSVSVERFAGTFENHKVEGAFQGDSTGLKPGRVRIECAGADLADLEKLLLPGTREGWLARLGVTRHVTPAWLTSRNLQAEVHLTDFSLGGTPLGSLRSHVHWLGTAIQFTGLQVQMTQGQIKAAGTINLAGSAPKYRFTGSLSNLPWRGGFLAADGRVEAAGSGSELLPRVAAEGTFSGQDFTFSPDNAFQTISGAFQLSFANGWPDLRLTGVEAGDGDEEWTGAAASESDGKLVFDLQHDGRQRRVVSTLSPDSAAPLPSATAMRRSF